MLINSNFTSILTVMDLYFLPSNNCRDATIQQIASK